MLGNSYLMDNDFINWCYCHLYNNIQKYNRLMEQLNQQFHSINQQYKERILIKYMHQDMAYKCLKDIKFLMKILRHSNYLLDKYHLLVKQFRQQDHLGLELKHHHYNKNLYCTYLLDQVLT